MAGTQGTAQAQLAEISSDSWPSSSLGSSHPGVLPAQCLGAGGFLPSADSWQPSSPHFLTPSSNVSVSMKPVLSTVFNLAVPPHSLFPFLGASHQLAGWLVRLWLLSVFCGSASSKRASFEFLPSLRAPQSLEWCLPHSRCSTGIC